MAFLNKEQLKALGLRACGINVQISDKASIYGAGNISIGDNVRIDDFCIISAGAEFNIGSFVHIACYSALIGKEKITVGDFVDISMKNTILSSTSDPSGDWLTSPVIPAEFLNTKYAPVVIYPLSVIYAHTLILPGVTIGEGAAVGAMSLVKRDVPPFEIWAGNPLRYIKNRNRTLKDIECEIKNRYIICAGD